MSDIPLILFAKAPIAGQVKTRLSTHCSKQQCADIAKILIQVTVQKAVEFWPGRIVLSVYLDQHHPFLHAIVKQYNLELSLQVDGNLGTKMATALDDYGYPAAVMACDVPHVAPQILQQAHRILKEQHEVIGCAQDGGFYLLGVNQASSELLAKQIWGTETVSQVTLALANQYQRTLLPLPLLRDIDIWDDLLEVSEQVAVLKDYLYDQKLQG